MREIEKRIRKNFDLEVGLTGGHQETIVICDDEGGSSALEPDALDALLRPGVQGIAIIGDTDGKPAIRFFWVQ